LTNGTLLLIVNCILPVLLEKGQSAKINECNPDFLAKSEEIINNPKWKRVQKKIIILPDFFISQ